MLDQNTSGKVLGLRVRCNKDGCDWEGELGDLKTHLSEKCLYMKEVCPHGCGQLYPRHLLQLHQLDECPQRPLYLQLETVKRQLTQQNVLLQQQLQQQLTKHEEDRRELQQQVTNHEKKQKQENRKWFCTTAVLAVGICAVGVGGAWVLWRPDKAQQALGEAHKALGGACQALDKIKQALDEVLDVELRRLLLQTLRIISEHS